MDKNKLQTELENVSQAIAAQEALRGILGDAQIEAALAPLRQKHTELQAQLKREASQASVSGSGAVAQGDGAKAVGERGVLVEGNVGGSIITGSGNVIHYNSVGEPVQLPPQLAALRDKITRVFNKSELQTLCFDLGIAADDLPGETRTALAQSLIAYCHQRQRLPQLLRRCQEQRPHIDWSTNTT